MRHSRAQRRILGCSEEVLYKASFLVLPKGLQYLILTVKQQPGLRLDSTMGLDLVHCIWGPQDQRIIRTNMQGFLHYCELQIQQSRLLPYPPPTNSPLGNFIRLLKKHPKLPRKDLRGLCERAMPNWAVRVDTQKIDAWLSLTARLILCINCRLRSDITAPRQSTQTWDPTQSIQDLADSTFPVHMPDEHEPTSRIRSGLLRAWYLEQHAGVEIVWTPNLADHLLLDIRGSKKTLFVFELASFANASCTAYKTTSSEMSSDQSFNLYVSPGRLTPMDSADQTRGCYLPDLLTELMKTYQLIFPAHDDFYLKKKVEAAGKDRGLLEGFAIREQIGYISPQLTNRRQLLERYRRWGLRLLLVHDESEDPTPTSWFERFSERKKSARHAYILTYLALVLALVLAIVTVALGIIQIWISYCDWKGDIGGVCGSPPGDGLSSTTGHSATVVPMVTRRMVEFNS